MLHKQPLVLNTHTHSLVDPTLTPARVALSSLRGTPYALDRGAYVASDTPHQRGRLLMVQVGGHVQQLARERPAIAAVHELVLCEPLALHASSGDHRDTIEQLAV